MQTRLITSALLLGLLSSCASPNRSTGLLQIGEDGLPETVTVLNDPLDQERVILLTQRIETRRKIVALVEQSHASVTLLYRAGRSSLAETAASEAKLCDTKVDLIDAQLALARTDLIDTKNSTVLDTDGDGLPDQIQQPLSVESLLKEKLSLRHTQYESAKQNHERSESLSKSGRADEQELLSAAKAMYATQAMWIDSKLELGAWQAAAAAR